MRAWMWFQSGSGATFIAWQNISFLPGTRIQSGSYMHGYISPGTYCVAPLMPATASGMGKNTPNTGPDLASFSIFPNPTNENFILLQKGEKLIGNVKVEVFTVRKVRGTWNTPLHNPCIFLIICSCKFFKLAT